jgi:oligopeptide/dipeptide ABC transporter ATP-binding protein
LTAPLLDIVGLDVRFRAGAGAVHAVTGATLAVHAGETLCVVGESGSGKSVTAMATMGLLSRTAQVRAERLSFDGRDLTGLSEREWRTVRGSEIGMIFQDPMSSLNPAHTVGMQLTEGLIRHRGASAAAARRRALEMLDLVRIPDAAARLASYPHQLSGGMRQRVMIAMALVCAPRLLIADEPTTALDVTIQAQILALMDDLKRELRIAMLFITHDLGVVADIADRVAVMYAGSVVESASAATLFDGPRHPYTVGLMRARPAHDGPRASRLAEIPGSVPRLLSRPQGCGYAPRCALAEQACRTEPPAASAVGAGHLVACRRHDRVPQFARELAGAVR